MLESGKRHSTPEQQRSPTGNTISRAPRVRHFQDRQEKPKKKQHRRSGARDPLAPGAVQPHPGTRQWERSIGRLLARDLQRLPPRPVSAAKSASAAPGPRAVRLASTCQAKSRTNMPPSQPTDEPGAPRRVSATQRTSAIWPPVAVPQVEARRPLVAESLFAAWTRHVEG